MAIPLGEEIKMILYGSSGIGKTHFLGTAALDERTWPALYLDMEGGTGSIQSKVRVLASTSEADLVKASADPQKGKVDVVRISDWNQVQSIYDFLFAAKSRNARSSYNCVIIDSLSEANQLALRYILSNSPIPNAEADVPEQRDYLKVNNIMKTFLRAFRDLRGAHVLMACLPRVQSEENTSISRLKPNLIGRLADEAMAIVDFVGYLRSNNKKERELIFQPEGRIEAKERTELGHNLELSVNPTVTALLDALEKSRYGTIKGEGTSSAKPATAPASTSTKTGALSR